jgi:uncharacterized DUF497 family protein
MTFEWDERKSAANMAKHAVSFLQAAEIFRGPRIETIDTRRDYGEVRVVALGLYEDVVFRVVFTRRDDRIRIISAWRAGRRDREKFKTARKNRPL